MSTHEGIDWRRMSLTEVQPYYVLGLLPPEDVPSIADNELLRGRDGDAILELASLSRPTWRDIGTLVDRALEEIGAPKLSVEQAWRIIAERILDRVEAGAITLPDAGSQLGMLTTVVPDAPEELLPLHGLEDYLDLSLLTDAQWDVALTQELAELRARLRGEHAEHGNDRYGLGALYWLRRYGTMPEQRA